jgi:hypothetical protein
VRNRRILLLACTAFLAVIPHSLAGPKNLSSPVQESLDLPGMNAHQQVWLLNPAAFSEKNHRLGFLVGRAFRHTSLKDQNQNETESNSKQDSLGASGHLPLPDGLSVGASHDRHFEEITSSRTDRNREVRETYAQQNTRARLTLDLASQMKLGLVFRHLQYHHTILGSFDTQTVTRVKGSLTGLGAGLNFDFTKFAVSLVYLQPMQGKTEILREEKRLVEPGMAQVGANVSPNEKISVGASISRYFYRRDDLAEATTADDTNQTPIDLRGVDPSKYLFPFQDIGAGLNLKAGERVNLALVLGQTYLQAIDDVATLPDPNNESTERFTVNYFKLGVRFSNEKFRFGFTGQYRKFARSFTNTAFISDTTLTQTERSLLIELSSQL